MRNITIVIIGIIVFIILSIGGCTDPITAKRILENSGYTNIYIGGYDMWSCSEDDSFHTEFTATSPNGNYVRGVVCSDMLKGATIRFK